MAIDQMIRLWTYPSFCGSIWGLPKMGVPPVIIYSDRNVHYKPTIFGHQNFRKPPCLIMIIILLFFWFETFFLHILGVFIPTNFHFFQRGGSTTNKFIIISITFDSITVIMFIFIAIATILIIIMFISLSLSFLWIILWSLLLLLWFICIVVNYWCCYQHSSYCYYDLLD